MDGLSGYIDELVQAATAYEVDARLSSVDEFPEMLEVVEAGLTQPVSADPVAPVLPTAELVDPIQDVTDELLEEQPGRDANPASESAAHRGGQLRDVRVVHNGFDPTGITGAVRVQVTDRGAEAHQGRVGEAGKPHLHGLVDPVPSRRRTSQRPASTSPATASSGSFSGTGVCDDFLEGEGVWHRDIKPDDIAIRIRPNRTRELVLIDFSLAGYPVHDAGRGCDPSRRRPSGR